MHARHGCVYHLDGSIMSGGKCVHDPPPYSGPSPPDETVIASGAWAIALWQIAPWCAGSQHPADAVEDTSIVYTRHASRFVRQHWPDGRPFTICEFVTHHPTLLFGACKCAGPAPSIGKGPSRQMQYADLLPLSGHSDMDEPVAGMFGARMTLRRHAATSALTVAIGGKADLAGT